MRKCRTARRGKVQRWKGIDVSAALNATERTDFQAMPPQTRPHLGIRHPSLPQIEQSCLLFFPGKVVCVYNFENCATADDSLIVLAERSPSFISSVAVMQPNWGRMTIAAAACAAAAAWLWAGCCAGSRHHRRRKRTVRASISSIVLRWCALD